jgi:uncharacterized protein (TIGR02449 family)
LFVGVWPDVLHIAGCEIVTGQAYMVDAISFGQSLGDENNDLRAQLQHITSERGTLLELKEQARSQVEGMIMRLRSMENA